MSKIAVVYWSGTGNTQAMAEAVLEGAKESGAEADLLTASEFDVDTLEGMPDAVDSFDEGAWYALVDHATVYGRDDVRFTFKNGVEIKA